MTSVADQNQFDVLSSPMEGKQSESRGVLGSKDDVKEQLFQAREQVKQKVATLREQVVSSNIVGKVTEQLQPAIDMAKQQIGIPADASKQEVVQAAKEEAEGQWETVKRKGRPQLRKAEQVMGEQLDQHLTAGQKSQLQRTAMQAKAKGRQAEGMINGVLNRVLVGPRLRPIRAFIQRNHLQLPVVILGAFLSLYLGLTLIRLITSVTHPHKPELDIHSREATMDWLKYHAGEYKDKAVESGTSLSGRAARFLANYEWNKMKAAATGKAIDWREIGMKKLGLREPTWGEWLWAKLTGRPITWQDRVEHTLDLAWAGINRPDLRPSTLFDKVKDMLHPHEPTMREKAAAAYESIRDQVLHTHEPTMMEKIQTRLSDGVDSIRSHLPGAGESLEAARQRAYEATHQSTLDKVKSGAEYIKNRVVHGSQEAAHIVQDRTNEVIDKAKYKTGL